MLTDAGWLDLSKKHIDFSAGSGDVIREYEISVCPADYVLSAEQQPVGIIGARKEVEGHRLTVVRSVRRLF